jgi:Na+/phosphate symporter
MEAAINSYIGLLIQVPLVGMFIWFTLRQNKDFLTAMERRDEQWREFLSNHTESTNQAIGRIAEEVKTLAREVSQLRGRDK